MITINLNEPVITLTLNPVGAGVSTLVIHSDYYSSDTNIPLGENYSRYPARYSWFKLNTNAYSELATGLYQYQHLVDGKQTDFGMLKVLNENEFPIIKVIPVPNQSEEDYNVFRG